MIRRRNFTAVPSFDPPKTPLSSIGVFQISYLAELSRRVFFMGNCCSDEAGGRAAVGGTAASQDNPLNAPNDAVSHFLNSRGYHGLYSQIEVLSLSLSLYFLRGVVFAIRFDLITQANFISTTTA